MKRLLCLLPVLWGLSGCADYRWVKPGASEHDRQLQLTACEAQALKDLPPDNVIEDAYTLSTLKDKPNDKKLEKDKETHNRIADANESKRGVLVNNCMLQNGWTQVVVN
ncbi:hypothetical protein ACSJL3_005198 (plasmid) [Serratia nevei]|uniref:hypothetical protein n=1 Tax=Serratia nevei TaxID=2703794 RepID=UPI003F6D5FB5